MRHMGNAIPFSWFYFTLFEDFGTLDSSDIDKPKKQLGGIAKIVLMSPFHPQLLLRYFLYNDQELQLQALKCVKWYFSNRYVAS